jgi:hypothetical protein
MTAPPGAAHADAPTSAPRSTAAVRPTIRVSMSDFHDRRLRGRAANLNLRESKLYPALTLTGWEYPRAYG